MALKRKSHITRTHEGAPFEFASYTERACIGVAVSGTVAVMDSKDVDGPVLQFGRSSWSAFVGLARDMEV